DSCSKGSFNGCFGVAQALLRGERGAAEAVPYLRYACGYKLPEACDELARLLDSGEIGTNLVEAASLSQYSCGQGIAAGCLRLSGYYDRGIGVMRDSQTAAELLERACQLGEPDACAPSAGSGVPAPEPQRRGRGCARSRMRSGG